VERILLVRQASDAGRPISSVSEMDNADLAALLDEDRRAREALLEKASVAAAPGRVGAAMEAVTGLDPLRLEQILRREVVAMGGERFLDELVTPLLVEIGERWRGGELRPAHEHVAVAVIKQILGWMLERARNAATGDFIVVGTLSGERHELGAMLAATAAALEGWRVVFTGEDLPPEEIALAAGSVGARVVGISVMNPLDTQRLSAQILRLLEELEEGTSLILGGRAAADLARMVADARVRALPSLPEFRDALRGGSTD
jgi:methanogenic corrinoid protein MtbC1